VEQFLLGATGVKEYLKSASSMVGKMSSQNYCGDEASDNMELITDQNEKD